MGCGTVVILLALIGLSMIAPVTSDLPPPEFALSLLLLVSFGIGWVTVTISFNCWLNLGLTRLEPIIGESWEAQVAPTPRRPEKEPARAAVRVASGEVSVPVLGAG
jgi:hypothetical protein